MNDRELAVDLLRSMVEINSMNPDLSDPSRSENQLAEYIGRFCKNLGLEVIYQEIGGRKNVIAILRGSGQGRSIIINGHTDTVGFEGMAEPLRAVERNGMIYGRGSFDMKGGIVASLMAIRAITEKGIKLGGDVIFAGVIDEEYGSLGTEELVRHYTADAAIICEPTKERIVIANKGFSWIRIDVRGKAAHGSKPHEGVDAIAKAQKLMGMVYDLNNTFREREHPLVGPPAIRVAKVEGGKGLSTVADTCTIYLERRTLPQVGRLEVEQELDEMITSLKQGDPDFDATYEFIIFRGGLELSRDEAIVTVLAKSYEDVIGMQPRYDGEPWWMDSALMAEHGIPTVVIGPKGDGAHAIDEHVEIDSVMDLTTVLEQTIVDFCS